MVGILLAITPLLFPYCNASARIIDRFYPGIYLFYSFCRNIASALKAHEEKEVFEHSSSNLSSSTSVSG